MEPNYTTDIYYTENGEEKSGKFIFINRVANYQFKDAIKRLCGISACRKNKSGGT
jgi:hypothetical protein